MNVDPFVQLRLLDVQALDTRLDQLEHRRRTLPEAARAAELAAAVAEASDRLAEATETAEDLERRIAKAEADVELVRQRAARDRHLLDSGSVTSARQLEGLQQELASLARRRSELEDAELEAMEQFERAAAVRAGVEADLAELIADSDRANLDRDAAYADLDEQAEQVRAERRAVAGDVADDLLALYERLRAANAGIGAAALYRGRCEGCRIQLTPTDIARIRDAPADEVLRCEECRRILVRTAESGLPPR